MYIMLYCSYFTTSLLLFLNTERVFSENILYVAAVASPSHHIWNSALAFGLAKKGHNVTHISPDHAKGRKPQNYTHILLEGVYDHLNEGVDLNDMSFYGPTRVMVEYENWCIHQCQLTLKSYGLQRLLDYPTDFKFDLIIFDITVGSCLYPLMHRFNYPPTVGVTAFLLPTYLSYSFGNNLYPSYIPWYGLPYTTEMNFMERVWNFVYTYADLGLRHVYQYREEHKAARKIFGENIPSMEDFERRLSLILVNTDPILDYSQPVPPNIILVGGLHTRRSEQMPDELRKILDNAKHGVIVMSLGTNIRSDKLTKDKQRAILDAFSKLSETVIWKFESNIENVPENVIIKNWLPQNDILGHPNVKLFIGHGGTLSTQETLFHGVPVVVMPFIVDQYINSKIIVNRKLGVQVDFRNITSDYFLSQLREILDKPVYTNNVKKLSELFKDRTETPLQRGIFWIEYVLRNGGAHSLNTYARDLPFYQRASFDVLLFLVLVFYVFIVIIFQLISFILKRTRKTKKIKLQ